MKRHPVLIPLSQEHHHSLALCLRILRDPKQNYQNELTQHFIDLEQHFQSEEQILATLWQKLNQPALRLRFESDHQQLRQLYQSPRFDCAEWNIAFCTQLREHARFEERELFPAIEPLLPND